MSDSNKQRRGGNGWAWILGVALVWSAHMLSDPMRKPVPPMHENDFDRYQFSKTDPLRRFDTASGQAWEYKATISGDLPYWQPLRENAGLGGGVPPRSPREGERKRNSSAEDIL